MFYQAKDAASFRLTCLHRTGGQVAAAAWPPRPRPAPVQRLAGARTAAEPRVRSGGRAGQSAEGSTPAAASLMTDCRSPMPHTLTRPPRLATPPLHHLTDHVLNAPSRADCSCLSVDQHCKRKNILLDHVSCAQTCQTAVAVLMGSRQKLDKVANRHSQDAGHRCT